MTQHIKRVRSEAANSTSTPFTRFINRYATLVASIIIGTTFLCGLLLFNMRIDEGGDDSTYISRAIDFLQEGRYPDYQGPLYPMFLAVAMLLVGNGLFALKATSLVLITVSQIVFYFALRRKINIILLLGVMALMSINSWLLYYASQTYSEALFIVIEYLFLAAALRFEKRDSQSIAQQVIASLPTAATIVTAFLVRTVGAVLGVAAIVFLLVQKKYRKAIVLLCSWLALTATWYGVRQMVWGSEAESGSVQLESLLQKHPYQAEEGQETLGGFVVRFAENSNLYLSKHLMKISGFRKAESRETSTATTLLLYALFGCGVFRAWRRNRAILLLAITAATAMGATFLILQTLWDQYRLIVPYIALCYIVILYGVYHILWLISKKNAAIGVALLGLLSGLMSFSLTAKTVDTPTLRKNLDGDPLYGYTTDWYNYLSMCTYASQNLPDTAYVAVRKPNMARLYGGGRKFYGIYRYDTTDPDQLIDNLRNRGVTHMIIASLRRDPANPGNGVINTLHYYISYISEKYPAAFRLEVSMGAKGGTEGTIYSDAQYEPAYLLAINYDYIDQMREHLKQQESLQSTDAQ